MNTPPISGPSAAAIAPAAATSPYARGRVGLAEVRRDERDDRGHDQHRSQALEERPADDQHRQVRGQRRRERPAGVDDAPDRERALAAEDLADLAAGDHQGRHHQRVERDRRLDPGDSRADVLGDRGDRRVHDGRVEGHDELPRRQRQQDDARCADLSVSRLGHCARLPRASPAPANSAAGRARRLLGRGRRAAYPAQRPRCGSHRRTPGTGGRASTGGVSRPRLTSRHRHGRLGSARPDRAAARASAGASRG